MRLGIQGLIFAGLTAFAAAACAQPASSGSTAQPSNPAPFPSRVLRQTTFNIPFTVETTRQPLEVQLYVSRDRGQTWQLYARQNPSARFFPFHATQDGEYWFASQTVDASRGSAGISGRQPELHVVIDTAQPQFEFQAAAGPSREIQVSWRGSDPTINPASLRIEYQAGREQPWQPVAVEPVSAANSTVTGRLAFVPRTAWVELQVRAEISDLAGNKAVVTRRLSLPAGAARPDSNQQTWRPAANRQPIGPDRPMALPPTTPPGNQTASTVDPGDPTEARNPENRNDPAGFGQAPAIGFGQAPAIGFGQAPAVGFGQAPDDSAGRFGQAPGAAEPTGFGFSRLFGARSPSERATNAAASSGIPVDPYADARPSSISVAPTTEWKTTDRPVGGDSRFSGTAGPAEYGADASRRELVPGNGYQPQPSHVHPLVSQQIAAGRQEARQTDRPGNLSSERPELDATAPSAIRADSNRVADRQLRMTSAMRFEVDYEFDAAAANGARSVELWGTRDQGQTWSRWQVDADRQSPLDVQVDGEGTFGFRIVIVGNNGLAGDAPKNGDDAEIWVGVDTTPPVVQITTATYGEGEHAGQLDIRWTAADAFFGENPISIYFSDRATGPWTTIAAGVPNSGRYFWPIDPRVPEQLFLRIEARDRAGNQGEYRLPDSINLSGFTPKARIRGIRPVKNPAASEPSSAGDPSPATYPSDLDTAPQAKRNPFFYR